ncbi:MAG: CobW family GTP-binding protein, partial [Flammeovirgaceae bacterium]
DILVRLAARKEKIYNVIIESTGVADPAPVAQLFINNMQLQRYFSLDGVICVVDAVNFELQKQQQPETIKQLVMADLILINKTDKVTDEQIAIVDDSIRSINQTAKRVRSTHTQIPINELLKLRAYDLVTMESTLTTATFFQPTAPVSLVPTRKPQHAHESAHDIQTFGMRFSGNLDFMKFNVWFNSYVNKCGNNLYRSKGVITTSTSNKKIIFQSVHHEIDGMEGPDWGNEIRENKMVFIGKNLDEPNLKESILNCLA